MDFVEETANFCKALAEAITQREAAFGHFDVAHGHEWLLDVDGGCGMLCVALDQVSEQCWKPAATLQGFFPRLSGCYELEPFCKPPNLQNISLCSSELTCSKKLQHWQCTRSLKLLVNFEARGTGSRWVAKRFALRPDSPFDRRSSISWCRVWSTAQSVLRQEIRTTNKHMIYWHKHKCFAHKRPLEKKMYCQNQWSETTYDILT